MWANLVVLSLISVNLVHSFSWTNCGNTTDPVSISSLNVVQNETLVLLVKGQGNLAKDVESPIKMSLKVEKKLFWGWTPVPCIDNFGSCTYNDVCNLSPYPDACPAILAGLPCKCPVKSGPYGGSLAIDLGATNIPKWLEKGSYRVTADIADQTGRLICIQLTMQLK